MTRKKIVVLDGFTLNSGDLDWDKLKALGDVTVYDRTPKELLVERAKDAEIILTNKNIIDREVITSLPNLRYVGILATGINNVDLSFARDRGVTVTNVPSYSTDSVAQLTFALILDLCHQAHYHSQSVFEGSWIKSKDFSYTLSPQIELAGKTMGIIGMGTIGIQVSQIAHAFGMKVVSVKRSSASQKRNYPSPVTWVEDLEQLVTMSDVISLHAPLTSETLGLVDASFLRNMKSSAFLINTARGPLIVEQDLADALNNKVIAGAGLDVLSQEPPLPDNPLLSAINCTITPHIAWSTREARLRMMEIAVNNVASFLDSSSVNTVN